MHETECTRNCWIYGAIAGLVVMLFASGVGDRPWIAGLFLGFVTFVLFGGFLIWLLCSDTPGKFDPNSDLPKPPPSEAPAKRVIEIEPEVATPAPAPVKPAPATKAEQDDLKVIVGIGPKIEELLNAEGVTRLAQIAAWTPEEVADFSHRLGRLGGRIESEDWIGQARALEARNG